MNEEESRKHAEAVLGITKDEFVKMCDGNSVEQIRNITLDLVKLLAKLMKSAEESKKAVNEVAAANFKVHELTDLIAEVDVLLEKHKAAGNATIPIENIKIMLSRSLLAEKTFLAVHGG